MYQVKINIVFLQLLREVSDIFKTFGCQLILGETSKEALTDIIRMEIDHRPSMREPSIIHLHQAVLLSLHRLHSFIIIRSIQLYQSSFPTTIFFPSSFKFSFEKCPLRLQSREIYVYRKGTKQNKRNGEHRRT